MLPQDTRDEFGVKVSGTGFGVVTVDEIFDEKSSHSKTSHVARRVIKAIVAVPIFCPFP